MVEIKNQWTGETIKTVDAADLCGANLRAADLCGADLRAVGLRAADLCGANLCGANLRAADLYGANLYAADLRAANLYAADLRATDLCGADLYGANLYGAKLYGAKRYIDGNLAITLRGPRPILILGPLGSRNDNLMALLTSAGPRIECGCFRGTLDDFKAAVEKNHADHPRHCDEYLAAVRMIKAWAKIETRHADQWERENPLPTEAHRV